MKKILALTLSLVMIVSMSITAGAVMAVPYNSFEVVPGNDPSISGFTHKVKIDPPSANDVYPLDLIFMSRPPTKSTYMVSFQTAAMANRPMTTASGMNP